MEDDCHQGIKGKDNADQIRARRGNDAEIKDSGKEHDVG